MPCNTICKIKEPFRSQRCPTLALLREFLRVRPSLFIAQEVTG